MNPIKSNRIQSNRIQSNRVRSDPIETIERIEVADDGKVTIQKNNYITKKSQAIYDLISKVSSEISRDTFLKSKH